MYIEKSLSKNEEIHRLFKHHWFAYIDVGIYLVLAPFTIGLTVPMALYRYLSLRYIEQGVTNKRVIHKTGIISRKTSEMKANAIETVGMDQGIFGRIFGYGTVTVTGRGNSDVVLKGIDDPMFVKRTIENISPDN